VNLGHALEAAGRMKEAIDTYRQVIQADPRNVLAHASLGVALAHQGDRQGGTHELEQAQALAPDDARVRATLDGLRESP
jgi:Flp pilus assembly protein TadD